jgi:presenilin 1
MPVEVTEIPAEVPEYPTGTSNDMQGLQMRLSVGQSNEENDGCEDDDSDSSSRGLLKDDATDSSLDGGRLKYGANHVMSLVKPVSITMWLVVILVKALQHHDKTAYHSPIMTYQEKDTDTADVRLAGAIRNSINFTLSLLIFTTVFYYVYKFRWMKLLHGWLCMSVGMLLGITGAGLAVVLIRIYKINADVFSFILVMWNFAVCGVVAIFWHAPDVVRHGYLVIISVIMAWLLTRMPEWTNLCMLMAVATYDIFAVLSPVGPLKAMVELSQQRQETIPGLIYEDKDLKLGIGDFVFYSVLLGRAAMSDISAAIAVFIVIVTGLCGTLLVLSYKKHALPALPYVHPPIHDPNHPYPCRYA